MGSVVYLMGLSLDGFIEGRDGKFGWSEPDEEAHRSFNQQAAEMVAFVYGRRMYQTMAFWQTLDQNPAFPDYILEFARIWKSRPKIVVSNTLTSVGEDCRLVRGDVAPELERLKRETAGPIGVGGPGLASTFAQLGLIDEYRLILSPVLVGGGKPYFPPCDRIVRLRLLETRVFSSGAVYLRYQGA